MSRKNLSRSKVESENSTFWQSKILKVIGILYHRIGNIDLCVKYLEESLHFYENNGFKDEDTLNETVEICLTLFNNYQQKKDREAVFNKFMLLVENGSQNDKFSLHMAKMCRTFVTSCFCQLLKSLCREDRQALCDSL